MPFIFKLVATFCRNLTIPMCTANRTWLINAKVSVHVSVTPGCGIQEVTGVAIGTNEIRTQQQQSMYNYTKFIPKITIRKLAFVQVTQRVVVAK